MKKRIVSVLIVCVMLAGLIPSLGVGVSAEAVSKSREEVVRWLEAQDGAEYDFGNFRDSNGDYWYGTQCVEFVRAYVNWLLTGDPFDDVCGPIGNGDKIWMNDLWGDLGWDVYEFTDGFVPQPGDIFSLSGFNVGHAGVVISSDSYSAIVADANARTKNPFDGDPVWVHQMDWDRDITIHIIRPVFHTHFYVTSVIERASCTKKGVIKKTCRECGESYTEVVPALGHSFGEWKVLLPNVLSLEGSDYRKCTRDGCTEFEIRVNESTKIWEYTIENGEATIYRYNGSKETVMIPSMIGEYPVTKLSHWDTNYEWLGIFYVRPTKKVMIPSSVTQIGAFAFSYCSSLKTVTIPNSVTTIGEMAFLLCQSLESVNIPDSVTTIGQAAFLNCQSLESVNIPDGVTTIGANMFGICLSLRSITIPKSVTLIEKYAFGDCKSLNTVYYGGTQEQWDAISVGKYNDPLLNANIVFNYSDGKDAQPVGKVTLPDGKGDANGDSRINAKDVVAIMKSLIGAASKGFNDSAADVNGDGKLNAKDVVLLMKYIVTG